jgi:hypothetical protein
MTETLANNPSSTVLPWPPRLIRGGGARPSNTEGVDGVMHPRLLDFA